MRYQAQSIFPAFAQSDETYSLCDQKEGRPFEGGPPISYVCPR
jgi:hypothetical protein